jgi:RimJ/RimL family protein N-acetyltransferase
MGGTIVNGRSPDQMMRIHVATLFDYDADGRLKFVREPGDPYVPPRLFMGRTLQGNVWHFRFDLPDDLTRELEFLCRSEPVASDFAHPPSVTAAIRAKLLGHAPIIREERGPAYLISESVRAPNDSVLISKGNAHFLQGEFSWVLRLILNDVDIGPVTAIILQDAAVSICYCARLSPWAAEAGVKTLPAMQGRGYATAAVAGWAAAIRERGLLPLYSTTWDKIASQRVARKLGMVLYGEDWSIE